MATLSPPLNFPPNRRRSPAELDESQIPSKALLAFLIVNWAEEVITLRALELAALEQRTYEAQREEHKVEVARLIAEGERLLYAWRRSTHVPLNRFTPAHLETLLRSLRETDRFQFGPGLHPDRKAEILASFDASR